MVRILGGVPAKECDCDRLLLRLLGDLRQDQRRGEHNARFVVVSTTAMKDGREGTFLFGHELDADWLEGHVMEAIREEAKDSRYKEEHR